MIEFTKKEILKAVKKSDGVYSWVQFSGDQGRYVKVVKKDIIYQIQRFADDFTFTAWWDKNNKGKLDLIID